MNERTRQLRSPILFVILMVVALLLATSWYQLAQAQSAQPSEVTDVATLEDALASGEVMVAIESDQDPFSITADLLGIDVNDLWTALEADQSIADMVVERNVDLQTIIDALIVAEHAFIDELVAGGQLSDEEAVAWRADVPTCVNDLVNSTMSDWDSVVMAEEVVLDSDNGDAVWAVEHDPFLIAADSLGMDVKEVWAAFEAGQSIADMAAEQTANLQAIIDVLVAAEYAFIDELVVAGQLSDEEAAVWRSDVPTYVNELVNDTLADWETVDVDAESGSSNHGVVIFAEPYDS